MKKNKLMFIAIIFIIILAGCSNKEYESAMENGKEAIEEENYEEARSFFEQALEVKANDNEAEIYLDQTEAFIQAVDLLNDGDLEEATKSFNDVLKIEEGSTTLHKEAEKQLAEIEEIETTHHDLDTALKEAEELEQKGNFKEAISLIDEMLDQDLTHPAFSSINQELNDFKTKLQDTKKNYDSINRAYKKAQKLDKNKEYDQALALIDDTLQKDFSHASFESLNQNLIKLQTDLQTAKKETDEQDKKQELINQVMGYWSHSENDFELCHFTKTDFVCAVVASDVYYYGRISSWDVDLDNETVMINGKDNSSGIASLPNPNTLVFGDETYNRISEKEVNNKLTDFGIDDKPEFFDINRYEEWDSQN